jgi:hypothetical protein
VSGCGVAGAWSSGNKGWWSGHRGVRGGEVAVAVRAARATAGEAVIVGLCSGHDSWGTVVRLCGIRRGEVAAAAQAA